jgi:DMSO/TMAO reductase YedYZ molybdopterin-dependent catalytic subunit
MFDLVAKRAQYIQRQIALNTGTVDVKFRGMPPEGGGPPNRDGMPKLPVGQHQVKNWPVLDLGEQPEVDTRAWKLEVGGLVEHPLSLTWADFLALPQVDDVSDFHCVTTWSRYDNRWRGVRFRTLAELAVPKVEARFVLCTGYDFMPGSDIPYTTNLPLERAVEDDVLLVHSWEGHPLPREHGGPCRMITPKSPGRARSGSAGSSFWPWIRKGSGRCAATRTPRSRGSTIGIPQKLEAGSEHP